GTDRSDARASRAQSILDWRRQKCPEAGPQPAWKPPAAHRNRWRNRRPIIAKTFDKTRVFCAHALRTIVTPHFFDRRSRQFLAPCGVCREISEAARGRTAIADG